MRRRSLGTNDIFAAGRMLACREAGVRIPEDISITGCDSTDLEPPRHRR